MEGQQALFGGALPQQVSGVPPAQAQGGGYQQPATTHALVTNQQGGSIVGQSAPSAAHPLPSQLEVGGGQGGAASSPSQPNAAMVVDAAHEKAPVIPMPAVPSASVPKGKAIDIPESSEKGAQKKASRIAIGVALKDIQFMSVLLFFVVSFVLETT
jgi:hypothetical protein